MMQVNTLRGITSDEARVGDLASIYDKVRQSVTSKAKQSMANHRPERSLGLVHALPCFALLVTL